MKEIIIFMLLTVLVALTVVGCSEPPEPTINSNDNFVEIETKEIEVKEIEIR